MGLDPNESFTPAVIEEFGKESIIVVKDSLGGQPIRRWYKKWKSAQGEDAKRTGELYDRLIAKVNAVVKDNKIKTVTFVWMQGEQDAFEKHGEVYAASLKGLIDQISADLKRKDINFVVGRLSDFGINNEKYPHWTIVRKAQVDVAEAYVRGAWVNTDDLNDGNCWRGKGIKNDLHYSVEGYRVLGKRFAEKAIDLINKYGHQETIDIDKK